MRRLYEDEILLKSVRRELQESIRSTRSVLNRSLEIAGITKKDDNSKDFVKETLQTLNQIGSLQSQLNRQKKILSKLSKHLRDQLPPADF